MLRLYDDNPFSVLGVQPVKHIKRSDIFINSKGLTQTLKLLTREVPHHNLQECYSTQILMANFAKTKILIYIFCLILKSTSN